MGDMGRSCAWTIARLRTIAACRQPRHERILSRALRFCAGIPDSRADVAFLVLGFVEVVNRDQLAVGPLHRAGVAEIPRAAVASKNDLIAPRIAVVVAQARADSEGRRAVPIRDRHPSVLEADQTRRIAAACVGRGLADQAPGLAGVAGSVSIDEVA